MYKQTPDEFEYDLQKSQDVIGLINRPVTMYRAMSFLSRQNAYGHLRF